MLLESPKATGGSYFSFYSLQYTKQCSNGALEALVSIGYATKTIQECEHKYITRYFANCGTLIREVYTWHGWGFDTWNLHDITCGFTCVDKQGAYHITNEDLDLLIYQKFYATN